jgi:hypothetical protein
MSNDLGVQNGASNEALQLIEGNDCTANDFHR